MDTYIQLGEGLLIVFLLYRSYSQEMRHAKLWKLSKDLSELSAVGFRLVIEDLESTIKRVKRLEGSNKASESNTQTVNE